MNKELSKAIMNRTMLRNVYLRKRSDENRKKVFQTAELLSFAIKKN